MREDFYYLISSMTIQLPPLRHRKSEILVIADQLLTQYSRQFDRPKPILDEEITHYLMEHNWPHNLPEFETALKTLVVVGDRSISLAALKATAVAMKSMGHCQTQSLKQAVRAASTRVERQLISQMLTATGGNRKRAADELGISYKALLYKIKQTGTDCGSLTTRNGSGL
jgi:transcriptional regulator with PAS, ATPase and Fis domain